MKLNEHSKNELRKEIEEAVKRVPEGQRIHLDKELIDDLIFFKGKNKEGTLIKVPIWTGEFLRKIDLSEISFENVLFQVCNVNSDYHIEDIMDAEDVSRFIKIVDSYYVPFINDDEMIDFSYTNANIDFSKIYGKTIVGCNFEGMDFSNANGECIEEIYDSNFSNTNIRIDFNNENLYLMTTDFTNNDFSYATVDADFFNTEGQFKINGSNFSNTGLHVTYVAKKIPSDYYKAKKEKHEIGKLYWDKKISYDERYDREEKLEEILSKYESDDYYKICLGRDIKEGLLNGCYINGKKVLSLEERQDVAKQKKVEYEKMKEDLLSSTMSNIEEQIKGFKGK